ncbi:P-II family nitrogen regulator [Sediminivirga luteola]|jgi:nitrogen regulatory protein P-II 1/nitrogen regulatory protein P-II 2|uniref:Nitrogen regulatory protein P-II 1 n=1 Tax=Sediminivirga luteola TaxID=1774748 RepID=A0A8J2TZ50_9MICO|nr:P-II family nitrogen regulator [Sediminivirga luteola]GGA19469.1 nitrogen regulatory protein P-II 1 [Sediminivirga luteola]
MKLITAVIQPTRLDEVSAALAEAGFTGLTITEVKGHGAQAGRTEYYRGTAYTVEFRTKIRIELLVGDGRLDDALAVITRAAKTGEIGDGKVWVTDVVETIRVRTGETGESAI